MFVLFYLCTSTIDAQLADDIIGKYRLPNNLDVEIYRVDDKYDGKIITLNGYKDGETIDYKNPDKEKRKDLLLGLVLIKGLEYDQEDKQWKNAKMYSPEKGMYVNLKVTEMREDEIEIVGSKFVFRKTLVWKKI